MANDVVVLRLKGVQRIKKGRVLHALPQRGYSKAHESSTRENVVIFQNLKFILEAQSRPHKHSIGQCERVFH
jgi:hypothetical protein